RSSRGCRGSWTGPRVRPRRENGLGPQALAEPPIDVGEAIPEAGMYRAQIPLRVSEVAVGGRRRVERVPQLVLPGAQNLPQRADVAADFLFLPLDDLVELPQLVRLGGQMLPQ